MMKNKIKSLSVFFIMYAAFLGIVSAVDDVPLVEGFTDPVRIREHFKEVPASGQDEFGKVSAGFFSSGVSTPLATAARSRILVLEADQRQYFSVSREASVVGNIEALSGQVARLIDYKRALISNHRMLRAEKDQHERDKIRLERLLKESEDRAALQRADMAAVLKKNTELEEDFRKIQEDYLKKTEGLEALIAQQGVRAHADQIKIFEDFKKVTAQMMSLTEKEAIVRGHISSIYVALGERTDTDLECSIDLRLMRLVTFIQRERVIIRTDEFKARLLVLFGALQSHYMPRGSLDDFPVLYQEINGSAERIRNKALADFVQMMQQQSAAGVRRGIQSSPPRIEEAREDE